MGNFFKGWLLWCLGSSRRTHTVWRRLQGSWAGRTPDPTTPGPGPLRHTPGGCQSHPDKQREQVWADAQWWILHNKLWVQLKFTANSHCMHLCLHPCIRHTSSCVWSCQGRLCDIPRHPLQARPGTADGWACLLVQRIRTWSHTAADALKCLSAHYDSLWSTHHHHPWQCHPSLTRSKGTPHRGSLLAMKWAQLPRSPPLGGRVWSAWCHNPESGSHSCARGNIKLALVVSLCWTNESDDCEIMFRWIILTYLGCQMMVSVFMSCSVPSDTRKSCSPSMICMA